MATFREVTNKTLYDRNGNQSIRDQYKIKELNNLVERTRQKWSTHLSESHRIGRQKL